VLREHEQVRQVRARQQQGGRIRDQHRPVQKRPLVELAAPGDVDEHRREEDDRGIEVQHRGHRGHEPERPDQEPTGPQRRPRQPGSDRLEQALQGGSLSDEQQARDEYEGRPGV